MWTAQYVPSFARQNCAIHSAALTISMLPAELPTATLVHTGISEGTSADPDAAGATAP